MMTAILDTKNKELIVRVPFDGKGRESSSGKSTIHATSGGNQAVVVDGLDKPLVIGLNAYVKK